MSRELPRDHPTATPWPGELPDGEILFTNQDGISRERPEAIFPILKKGMGSTGGDWEFVGTGFYITSFGVFVTAKHVMQEFINADGIQIAEASTLFFFHDNTFQLVPITKFSTHATADVCVGGTEQIIIKATNEYYPNERLAICLSQIEIGDTISTFAFPHHVTFSIDESKQAIHFSPKFYNGAIQQYLPNGSGCVRSPCFLTNMHIYGGASGGPVCNKRGMAGAVVGINSSSFAGMVDCSFISPISDILGLVVTEIQLEGESVPRAITIQEMITRGFVSVLDI